MQPNDQLVPPNLASNPGVHFAKTPEEVEAPKKRNPSSSQNTLLFSEIRDDMVIMADGSFRAVIACKSINFDLMSSREKEAIEYGYQNFLNSLSYPIQILIRSKRVDIGPYLDKLYAIRQSQDNMLLNVLMDDYMNFIDALSQTANIMKKDFFVVVPYSTYNEEINLVTQSKGFFGSLFNSNKVNITKIDKATYEKSKEEIGRRVESTIAGLRQMGIPSVQLNTKQLGVLYYDYYNPDTAVNEPLGDFSDIATLYVKKAPSEETPNV